MATKHSDWTTIKTKPVKSLNFCNVWVEKKLTTNVWFPVIDLETNLFWTRVILKVLSISEQKRIKLNDQFVYLPTRRTVLMSRHWLQIRFKKKYSLWLVNYAYFVEAYFVHISTYVWLKL